MPQSLIVLGASRLLLLLILFAAQASYAAKDLSACRKPLATPELTMDTYPDHKYSPMQAYHHHDHILYATLVVPAKTCSLGVCAGFRVHKSYKSKLDRNIVVRLSENQEDLACVHRFYSQKDSKWTLFGFSGTSKAGFFFLDISSQSPSYPVSRAPNWHQQEQSFQKQISKLNHAIKTTLSK